MERTGWNVAAPVMPWEGRRMAAVLVSNEILAQILRGEGDRCVSSAPSDLTVVGVTTHDGHTITVYIESESLEPLGARGAVPVFNATFTRKAAD